MSNLGDRDPYTCVLRQKRTLGKFLLGFTFFADNFEGSEFKTVYLDENTKINHQNETILVSGNGNSMINFNHGAVVVLEKDDPKPRKTNCQQIIEYTEDEFFYKDGNNRRRLEEGDLLLTTNGMLIFENLYVINEESYDSIARVLHDRIKQTLGTTDGNFMVQDDHAITEQFLGGHDLRSNTLRPKYEYTVKLVYKAKSISSTHYFTINGITSHIDYYDSIDIYIESTLSTTFTINTYSTFCKTKKSIDCPTNKQSTINCISSLYVKQNPYRSYDYYAYGFGIEIVRSVSILKTIIVKFRGNFLINDGYPTTTKPSIGSWSTTLYL